MSRAGLVYAGVDIGNTKIIITIGTFSNDNDFRIIGSTVAPCDSEYFSNGCVLHIDEIAKSIKFGIKNLSHAYNVVVSDAFFGFSGHIDSRLSSIISDVSRREVIAKTDLDSLRNQALYGKREGREILDVIVTRYTLDDRVVRNPLGNTGYSLKADFIVVSGSAEQLKLLRKVAQKAGLKLHGFVLHQIAAAKTLVSNDAKEAGVVVVDLGADITKVAVYFNNALVHVSNIVMGGNIVSNDIKLLKQVPHKVAEKVKHDYGFAHVEAVKQDSLINIGDSLEGWGQKQFNLVGLTQIIQARLEMNFDMVANEISKSNFYDAIGYGVVLTGGGAFMRNVAELFTLHTGLDARVGPPVKREFLGDSNVMSWPWLAVATGVLLEGIERPFILPEQKEMWSEEAINGDEKVSHKKTAKGKSVRPEKQKKAGNGLFKGLGATLASLFDDDSMETGKDTAI